MRSIADNLQAVKARIAGAARAAGRDPGAVALLAVSKTHASALIEEAFRAGQRAFGENYVQEALDKMAALVLLPIEWHLIGPLQSNKTRAVAERFQWVHSVDRERIARRLSEQRPEALPPLDVLLQVNVSGEAVQERRRAARGGGAGEGGGGAAAPASARLDGGARAHRGRARAARALSRGARAVRIAAAGRAWRSTPCRWA